MSEQSESSDEMMRCAGIVFKERPIDELARLVVGKARYFSGIEVAAIIVRFRNMINERSIEAIENNLADMEREFVEEVSAVIGQKIHEQTLLSAYRNVALKKEVEGVLEFDDDSEVTLTDDKGAYVHSWTYISDEESGVNRG
jgi:hypothetical protein